MYTCTHVCRSHSYFHVFVSHTCTHRQQIEDLEGKVKILKEQMKKKEENEAKYQGEGYPLSLSTVVISHLLIHLNRVIRSAEYNRRAASQRIGFTQS